MRNPGRRRVRRRVPMRYDDGFRGLIATAISTPLAVVPLVVRAVSPELVSMSALIGAVGLSLTVFSAVYVIWTHGLFAATPHDEAMRIAAVQHRRGPSRVGRLFGFGGTANWVMSAATAALVVATASTVVWHADRSLWLPLIALVTAAFSWVLMAYAFALRYFRLHAAGERIDFDIEEQPIFRDFVSMAIMLSASGAIPAATVRTRPGLDSVRTHTFVAFAFNSLVIAMTVSLVVGLVGVA